MPWSNAEQTNHHPEVQSHIGLNKPDHLDGFNRWLTALEVVATGKPISVPVGKAAWVVFSVVGNTIDGAIPANTLRKRYHQPALGLKTNPLK